jgi:hypothetical protein
MAVIYSSDLKLSIISTGTEAGVWGQITNTNLYLLQQAIGGYEAISIAGGAQTTALTMSNGAISNARNAVIKLTGTITGNQVVTVPTGVEKTYIVSNGTVGAFTVEFKTASGTGPTFSTTDKGIKILFADGTNVVDVNANFSASSFPQINDSNGNEEIKFTTTASAVNEFTITNAATANAPEISATGSDTNIDLKITPKGSGKINLDGIKFPNADGSSGQFLKTDGSGSLSFADSGLAWQSVVTTSTITVVAGRAYFINTTSNACTVTLPSGTPTAGAQVQLVDYAGTFDTNNLTINPNGNKIEGGTANLQLKGEREGVILTFIDATQGWLATSGINEGTDALEPVSYSIDFLVVAGGGGGGRSGEPGGYHSGAGGGAGGFRTSTQSVTPGTVITVIAGNGGAGSPAAPSGTTPAVLGGTGSNSSISGSGLTTITSAGGGGGANAGIVGGDGGSGGGSASTTGGSGNTPSTSPSQGNNGGSGNYSGPYYGAGGGGGASAVGGNGTTTVAGNGGAGTASSISGSSVTYAGGGGGGTYDGGTSGTGGTGGGGNAGAAGGTNNGSNGTVNTGGGGGGSSSSGPGGALSAGGNGGKGVVVLSMPDANFSGTTTGSPTSSLSGVTRILIFNGDGSYTA